MATNRSYESRDRGLIGLLVGGLTVVGVGVLACGLLVLFFALYVSRGGEIASAGVPEAGLLVYGTRPFRLDFAWAFLFWFLLSGVGVAGALIWLEEVAVAGWSALRRAPVTHAPRGSLLGWALVLIAVFVLSGIMFNACVRDEAYRRELRLDGQSEVAMIVASSIAGEEVRSIAYDDIADLTYHRTAPSGMDFSSPYDQIVLHLRSGETVPLFDGHGRDIRSVMERLIGDTPWDKRCTGWSGYHNGESLRC